MIGCVDGHTYVSDYMDNKEIEEQLPIKGAGVWDELKINTLEEYAQFITKGAMGESIDDATVLNIQLTINEQVRYFQTSKIVWCEVQTD